MEKTFTDPRLCAAIVDRVTYNGQIIETGTTNYRLEHGRPTRTVSTGTMPNDHSAASSPPLLQLGVMLMTDQTNREPIGQVLATNTAVVISSTSATIAVRHAQDIDDIDEEQPAEVTVQVILGAAFQQPTFAGSINIPTGALLIADAEQRDVVSVSPGRYAVQVLAVPLERAEHITIWLSPLT